MHAAYVVVVVEDLLDFLPPAILHSEGGIVFSSVCLCVCLSTR